MDVVARVEVCQRLLTGGRERFLGRAVGQHCGEVDDGGHVGDGEVAGARRDDRITRDAHHRGDAAEGVVAVPARDLGEADAGVRLQGREERLHRDLVVRQR